jgi:hypothetical protein
VIEKTLFLASPLNRRQGKKSKTFHSSHPGVIHRFNLNGSALSEAAGSVAMPSTRALRSRARSAKPLAMELL